MTRFCSFCEVPYTDENSEALEPQSFCSRECQTIMDGEPESVDDTDYNTCQQCFHTYGGEAGDGFCSDSCEELYDKELLGAAGSDDEESL